MSDLTTWLDGWGLGQLAPRLAEQDIDLDALQYLTEDDLKELGLTIGLRRHLLRAIEQGLRRPAAEAASSAGDRPGANQAAERRQLTILFSDLAASTELSSRLDPEEMGVLLHAYQACCTAAIELYGGQVSRFSGDGILAYFCYPQGHEDDAERAVRAALSIVRDVPQLRPLGDISLRVRLGIATGQVMIGEDELGQIDVVGETPNLAARLQAQASPNGIVISAGTQRLVRGLFNCASLGAMQLKGFPTPVPVWEVHGESAAESRFDARHARAVTPMVGRERELDLLMDCWERAVGGDAQVALISGEAGVGKSRMLRALRTALEPSQPNVLSLYCSAYHQASALHPIVNYYERLAGIVHNDAAEQRLAKLETLLRSSGAVLEQTVPIVASLLSIPLGDRYVPLGLTPEQLKERTLELLIQRIRDSALQQPVLCLIEDVHWIDPTLSQLISRMIAALKTFPVFLIVTSRTPAETLWLQDETALTHLSLARLDRVQAETLLRHSVGGRAMSREVSAEIIERADGIPLFVEELSKTVVEFAVADAGSDGKAPPEAVVPATLYDSLMARLDRMSPVKPVAQLAAVIGRSFSVQLLSAVAPPELQPIDAAIDALAAAEIILPLHQSIEPAYQFKHALLQDVAYQSLLRTTRRKYHALVARTLDERFSEMAGMQPEIVARHFTEAGITDKAIGYWLQAGQRAIASSSNLEAISHFRRGLGLLNQIADPDERARVELRFTLALLTPLIAVKGYASPEIEAVFERAIALGEAIGETEEIFPALYSRQAFDIVIGRFDLALLHVEHGMELAKRHPRSELGAFASMKLGVLKLYLGEFTGARDVFGHLLSIYDVDRHRASAHTVGQDHYSAVGSMLTLVRWHLGHADQAKECRRLCLEHTRSLDHVNSLGYAVAFADGCFGGLSRDVDILESATAELLELGRVHSLPIWTGVGTGLRGKLLVEQGRVEEGIAELRAGIAKLSAMRIVLLRSMFIAWLATALAARGEADEGFAAIDAWWEAGKTAERWMDAELHRARGELHLIARQPDRDAAERSFREALAIARRQGARVLELRAAGSLARLWRGQGRAREAHALLAPAVAWFTEGRDTADLREAEALLRTLA